MRGEELCALGSPLYRQDLDRLRGRPHEARLITNDYARPQRGGCLTTDSQFLPWNNVFVTYVPGEQPAAACNATLDKVSGPRASPLASCTALHPGTRLTFRATLVVPDPAGGRHQQEWSACVTAITGA
ncbi:MULTISPECIES: hypothetical protein [Streptomyces]|uniref:hypothetical protein n=1 Tax=Streptomyces TaxID=1883 RepID=UPI00167AACA0|nr:hypothetical protein [Streptomyces canarius]